MSWRVAIKFDGDDQEGVWSRSELLMPICVTALEYRFRAPLPVVCVLTPPFIAKKSKYGMMSPLPVHVGHIMCGDDRDDGEHKLVQLTMATCWPPSLAQTARGRGTHLDVRGFAATGAQEVSG